MGENRPNDVAVGYEDVGRLVRSDKHLLHRLHRTLLHFTERFTSGRPGLVRVGVPVPLGWILGKILASSD